MVCAWPEPPFARHAAIIVGVHDGMEALACAITITESSNSLASETEARPSRWIYGSRKAPRTFAMRAPGGQGLGNALVPFYFVLQERETAACGLATASLTHSRASGLGSTGVNLFFLGRRERQ